MPFSSLTAARNAILIHFKTAWDAQTPPIPPVIYDDVAQEPPADGSVWVRVSVKHSANGQQTLGAQGNRRFGRIGIVVVQVFTPYGGGLTANDIFAKVAVDAFEGKSTAPDAVTFSNVRSNEIGQSGDWFQTNVIAEFEYDEIK